MASIEYLQMCVRVLIGQSILENSIPCEKWGRVDCQVFRALMLLRYIRLEDDQLCLFVPYSMLALPHW
jgi:hypothetical protein